MLHCTDPPPGHVRSRDQLMDACPDLVLDGQYRTSHYQRRIRGKIHGALDADFQQRCQTFTAWVIRFGTTTYAERVIFATKAREACARGRPRV